MVVERGRGLIRKRACQSYSQYLRFHQLKNENRNNHELSDSDIAEAILNEKTLIPLPPPQSRADGGSLASGDAGVPFADTPVPLGRGTSFAGSSAGFVGGLPFEGCLFPSFHGPPSAGGPFLSTGSPPSAGGPFLFSSGPPPAGCHPPFSGGYTAGGLCCAGALLPSAAHLNSTTTK